MAATFDAGSVILAVNAGSSSIKCALFRSGQPLLPVSSCRIERIGLSDSAMTVTDRSTKLTVRSAIQAQTHDACVGPLTVWLEHSAQGRKIGAIGHRIVHGGTRYSEPQRMTPEVLDELRRLSPYDPEHMPAEIGLIEAFQRCYPNMVHVACFDTSFHHALPQVARLLPIPRRYGAAGVQRYGFHGISYAYLMDELARVGGSEEAVGLVILAHLGNGASLAAVREGKSLDTTMGFTPTSGLPMSTRSGDLDPGLLSYLARIEGMTIDGFHQMVNRQSGLLGVSETSPDLRDLLACESEDARAAEAVALFCYQTRKWIGALTAVLGGLETLVFSGGIGENSAVVRARICDGLGYLGIELDESRNHADEPIVSSEHRRVTVRVIRTDEEMQIARSVYHLLAS